MRRQKRVPGMQPAEVAAMARDAVLVCGRQPDMTGHVQTQGGACQECVRLAVQLAVYRERNRRDAGWRRKLAKAGAR